MVFEKLKKEERNLDEASRKLIEKKDKLLQGIAKLQGQYFSILKRQYFAIPCGKTNEIRQKPKSFIGKQIELVLPKGGEGGVRENCQKVFKTH